MDLDLYTNFLCKITVGGSSNADISSDLNIKLNQ